MSDITIAHLEVVTGYTDVICSTSLRHVVTVRMQADRLADQERMLHLLGGKPIPDNRENTTLRLDDHNRFVQGKQCYEDEMFCIKYFKKGLHAHHVQEARAG